MVTIKGQGNFCWNFCHTCMAKHPFSPSYPYSTKTLIYHHGKLLTIEAPTWEAVCGRYSLSKAGQNDNVEIEKMTAPLENHK